MQNYDELKVSELDQHDVPYGHALVQVKAAGLTFVDLLYVSKHSNGYATLKDFTSLSFHNNPIIIIGIPSFTSHPIRPEPSIPQLRLGMLN
jgi:hypothetical protein